MLEEFHREFTFSSPVAFVSFANGVQNWREEHLERAHSLSSLGTIIRGNAESFKTLHIHSLQQNISSELRTSST